MQTVVMKFGGSSLATVDKIQAVANRIISRWRSGARVAVVVSAMGSTTNDYMQLAESVCSRPSARELDVLLTAGEQVSISLLAMVSAPGHCGLPLAAPIQEHPRIRVAPRQEDGIARRGAR